MIYLVFIVFSLFVFVDIGILQSSSGQAPQQPKNDSKDQATTAGSILAAIITAAGTILVAFRQYKKGKEAQAIEHKNRLEYNYSIDLRKRRLNAYVRLWKLTHITFDMTTTEKEIKSYKDELNNWYYLRGRGMLLTEPSQKLFDNFKKVIEELVEDKDPAKRWDNLEPGQKEAKITSLKDNTASGLRSSLLKDVGTRGELRNLPFYNELVIEEPKEKEGIRYKYLEVNYGFFGSQTEYLDNKEILLQITDLDKNKPIAAVKESLEKLEPGKWHPITWCPKQDPLLVPGNYSARIITQRIMSEKRFKYPFK